MNGELSVKSQLGVGSCFTLSLPINKNYEDRPIQNPEVSPYVPQLPIETYTPERLNTHNTPEVLVVDDNVEMANFIANCLPRNFKVALAYDGKEGMKIAEANIPNLIISDVMMPKIDGFPLTETLKKNIRTSTSQLYRKMMALTGQSTSKFFRSVQLKKATTLLQNSDLHISEIAYQSGFNDPAYFSRVFTAEFGLSPSQYREKDLNKLHRAPIVASLPFSIKSR